MDKSSRLVITSLPIEFSHIGNVALDKSNKRLDTAEYLSPSLNAHSPFWIEFHKFSQRDNDPVIEWLMKTKSKRGGMDDDQALVLDFLVEIYRKLETIESKIANKTQHYEPLSSSGVIDRIGHGCFSISTQEEILHHQLYYGRVDLPTFPKRLVPLFFTKEGDMLYVQKIHTYDESEWDGYVASKERDLIREIKRKKDIDATI